MAPNPATGATATRAARSIIGSLADAAPSPGCLAQAPSTSRWSGSVRQREQLAPAVRADVALDHLAGFRRHEQRAGRAHPDVLRTVLLLRLRHRHLLLRCRPQ